MEAAAVLSEQACLAAAKYSCSSLALLQSHRHSVIRVGINQSYLLQHTTQHTSALPVLLLLDAACCWCVPTQPLELLKTRFQLNEGRPMRILPAVRGEGGGWGHKSCYAAVTQGPCQQQQWQCRQCVPHKACGLLQPAAWQMPAAAGGPLQQSSPHYGTLHQPACLHVSTAAGHP